MSTPHRSLKASLALLIAGLLLVMGLVIACSSSVNQPRSESGATSTASGPMPSAGQRSGSDAEPVPSVVPSDLALPSGVEYPPYWPEITLHSGEVEPFASTADALELRAFTSGRWSSRSRGGDFIGSADARHIVDLSSGELFLRYSAPTAAPNNRLYSQLSPSGNASDPSRLRETAHAGGVFIGNDIDEVWIIVAPEAMPVVAANTVTRPGTGSLLCPLPPAHDRKPGEPEFVPIPLEHTSVSGAIQGSIASVSVTQRFANPFNEKIEAVYVFPLPHNAAVHDFVMTVGERKIRGVIREREQAERIYHDARARGHVASLLTQERDNVFTQKVANIEPGKRIDVTIDYFHTLAYVDGWFEWAFPMVVAPRFNPPQTAAAGAGVGAAPLGAPGSTGQRTEVQYLRPEQRTGHDIAIDLVMETGFEARDIRSASHQIRVTRERDGRRRIALDASDTIPNKDFVLRFRPAKELSSGLVLRPNASGDGGYFTLLLTPPESLRKGDRAPVEFIFAIDTSGSMNGKPMHLAKQAILAALDRVRPEDAVQIVTFAGTVTTWSSGSQPGTRENIRSARQFVDSLRAGGGTMMLDGINAALRSSGKTEGRERFIVFITDGLISNEHEILSAIHNDPSDCRVFSFGVGSSTNRALLESMARVGRGAVAHIGLSDKASEVMALFFDRVSHPALRHIEVAWGGLEVEEMYPRRVPDLMVGRPVVLHGRYRGSHAHASSDAVRVVGFAGADRVEVPVRISGAAGAIESRAMESVWARAKIADLALRALGDANPAWVASEIRSVALSHNLMSAFTAFVAVDSLSQTTGSSGVTVGVPVPVPQGVRYETTVPGGAGGAGGGRPIGMDDRGREG